MGDCKSGSRIVGVIKFVSGFAAVILAHSVLYKPLVERTEGISWLLWLLSIGALISGMIVMFEGLRNVFRGKQEDQSKRSS